MPVMKCLKRLNYKGKTIKPGQSFKVKDSDANVLKVWKFAELAAPKQTYKTRELEAEKMAVVSVDLDPNVVEEAWSGWDKMPDATHTTPKADDQGLPVSMPPVSPDYSSWTKPRLQAALDARGIEWKAWESKATLIDRLR